MHLMSIFCIFSGNSVTKSYLEKPKDSIVETTLSSTSSVSQKDESTNLKSWNVLSSTNNNNEQQLSTAISQNSNNFNDTSQDIVNVSEIFILTFEIVIDISLLFFQHI